MTEARDWDEDFWTLVQAVFEPTARCRHCAEDIAVLDGASNCGQVVWVDSNGSAACGQDVLVPQPLRRAGDGVFRPSTLHEPVPAPAPS